MVEFDPEKMFQDAISSNGEKVETPIYDELTKMFNEMQFDPESKEAQMFKAILAGMGDLEEDINEQSYRVSEIDEDLAEVEGEFFGEDGFGAFDENTELFEMNCPECSEKIYLDIAMLQQEKITCPSCGAEVDFEVDLGGGCSGGCGGCSGCE